MAEVDADAVVVGTGPAGATAADVLTGAGWSVVMLEKGANHLLDLDAPYAPLGHVSNDELKFLTRHFLGPDPFLEPRTFRHRESEGDRIHVGGVNNLPSTVGGGGFHADGKLPRFREVDFHARSELGPIEGAHLVDWPFGYDELEPYYAAAERFVGVAGDHHGNPFAAWRSGPYPMPPGPDMYCARLTSEAATELGFHPYRAPTGVNSVEYDGRPACNNCGFCAFFGCPIHAKGDPIAMLLRSGVGNPDVVGRYLMYHLQTYVLGIFPFRLHAYRGRSVTHLMDDPIVPDDEATQAARDAGLPYFRGGIVEHGGGSHPVVEAMYSPRGEAHTRAMLESPMRDRMAAFTMQGEDLPQVTNRIDLDPSVTDVWGLPAGRVTYAPHRHEAACAAHWAPRLETVLRRAGAQSTFWITSPPLEDARGRRQRDPTPISRHVMGTARLGTDPRTSVCDPWQRLHDVDNVLVADSSVFPTSTGYGPTLTLVALAIRACRALAGLEPLRSSRPVSAERT